MRKLTVSRCWLISFWVAVLLWLAYINAAKFHPESDGMVLFGDAAFPHHFFHIVLGAWSVLSIWQWKDTGSDSI